MALLLSAHASAHEAVGGARQGPRVRVEQGLLEGSSMGRAEQFLGVPFAAPPLGARRWRPPAPAERWRGARDATAMPAPCAQTPASAEEDCLYLNVYRPRGAARGARLPVLVWIHGGAFVAGSNGEYDASELSARTGTIVVTINYRLGVFGFLSLAALSAEAGGEPSGNYGWLDQQAALEWVGDNIDAFGGDPRRVTIAGESAGGTSVCGHLTSPPARGLFDGAIIQSAFCTSIDAVEAEARGAEVAAATICEGVEDLSCLRALPASALLEASNGFEPALVSGGVLLPSDPAESVAAGQFARVPVVIGNVADETRVGLTALFPLAPELYPFILQAEFGPLAPLIAAEYPASAYDDPVYALSQAASDGFFGGCQVRRQAAAFSRYTPTYLYEFDDPDAPVPLWVELPEGFVLGSSHTSELAYLFEPEPLVRPDSAPFTGGQRRLAAEMQLAWGAFAARGAPGSQRGARWPQYDPARERVMRFQPGGSRAVSDYAEARHCGFWDAILGQ